MTIEDGFWSLRASTLPSVRREEKLSVNKMALMIFEPAYPYLTDVGRRSAEVVRSLEMSDALRAFFHVRFVHRGITQARFCRELGYWDLETL